MARRLKDGMPVEKLIEKGALSKLYRAMTEKWFSDVFAIEPEGPRLRRMSLWLDGMTIDDAPRLLDVVKAQRWLFEAPPDVRFRRPATDR